MHAPPGTESQTHRGEATHSSLICAGYWLYVGSYRYIYAMHDFNRLMSAMSIDGIWQNNLIYFEIRQNAASLFGIHIRIQGG